MYALIDTPRLNGVDSEAWLADVIARFAEHAINRVDELLPWNWRRGQTNSAGLPVVRAPAKVVINSANALHFVRCDQLAGDFHPQECAHAGPTKKKGQDES